MVDKFCGSGTMHVAVVASGRNVVSIDYNQTATESTMARYAALVDLVKADKELDVSKI